jgi:hypothetical protein
MTSVSPGREWGRQVLVNANGGMGIDDSHYQLEDGGPQTPILHPARRSLDQVAGATVMPTGGTGTSTGTRTRPLSRPTHENNHDHMITSDRSSRLKTPLAFHTTPSAHSHPR